MVNRLVKREKVDRQSRPRKALSTEASSKARKGRRTVKILIADNHDLFREGLRLVLQHLDASLQIIEAANIALEQ